MRYFLLNSKYISQKTLKISFIILMTEQVSEEKKIKVDKYDRQIRLWGPRGQRALGNARVALVQCTGAGIQAVKNLILPGVGTIDIWDQRKVKITDLSSSFFYEHQNVGQPKAEVALKNLLQMNPDSKGNFFIKSVEQFLKDEAIISSYNLVIFGGEMTQENYKSSSQKLWKLDVPCIFITLIGPFFYLKLQKKIHFVQSSNTLSKKYYLRVTDPFPELLEHANNNNIYQALDNLEGKNVANETQFFSEFSNIPLVLVLISVIQKLPEEKRRNIETVRKEIEQIIKKSDVNYRQNLNQALAWAVSVIQTPEDYMIDINLLENEVVKKCTKDSHLMIKILYAINKFFKEQKQLPQSISLPDMHTTTKKYIDLKNIYKNKHKEDAQKVIKIIKEQLGDQEIDEQLVSEYINNLPYLEVAQMKSYVDQIANPEIYNYFYEEKDLLIAIRTYQSLYCENMENVSYQKFKSVADSLQQQYKIDSYDERYLKEVYRSKGQSHISIYSIAGAMIGQEAIKLITGCFTPMSGGFIFDGANGKGYPVRL